MSSHDHPGEYECEPIPGLPESLPEGEEILWQGSPCLRSLARRAFHTDWVLAYFGVILAWSLLSSLAGGRTPAVAVSEAGWVLVPFVSAIALLLLLAWLNTRATVYTITDRRVVVRFGVAIQMAVNLPFRTVQSADLRCFPDGSGDVSLRVVGVQQVGALMLWPHARPWRFGKDAEPTLRCIPEAEHVAELLARALATSEQRSTSPLREAPKAASEETLGKLVTAAS